MSVASVALRGAGDFGIGPHCREGEPSERGVRPGQPNAGYSLVRSGKTPMRRLRCAWNLQRMKNWKVAIATIACCLSILVPVKPAAAAGGTMSAAAWNGEVHLVVWMVDTSTSWTDLYAARVKSDGTVLDPGGFPIATSPGAQWWPKVASDGTDFFVAWSEIGQGVFGTRVRSDGTVEHADGRPLVTGPGYDETNAHDLTWSGDHYTLVTGARESAELLVSRLEPDGSHEGEPHVVVSSLTSDDLRSVSVAWNGSTTILAWAETASGEPHRIHYVRLDERSEPLEPTPLTVPDAGWGAAYPNKPLYALRVATDGHNFVIAWTRQKAPYEEYDVHAARIGADGRLIDLAPILVAAGTEHVDAVDVGWDGSSYVVAWEAGPWWDSQIRTSRLPADGTYRMPSIEPGSAVTASHSAENPVISGAADHYLVLWSDRWSGEVVGAIGDSGKATSSPFVVAR